MDIDTDLNMIDPAMQLVLGAGLVRPAQPPGRQGPSYPRVPTCPPGFESKSVGPGQYECVPSPVPVKPDTWGAGLVRPAQPPGRQGPSYPRAPACPPGFEAKLVGPGQYECRPYSILPRLVVNANDRTLGSGEDSSIPDPLHSNCVITFHCTRDASGRQHCTSTSNCGSMHGLTAASIGAGLQAVKAPDGSRWVCEPQQCRWDAAKGFYVCDPPVCRPA